MSVKSNGVPKRGHSFSRKATALAVTPFILFGGLAIGASTAHADPVPAAQDAEAQMPGAVDVNSIKFKQVVYKGQLSWAPVEFDGTDDNSAGISHYHTELSALDSNNSMVGPVSVVDTSNTSLQWASDLEPGNYAVFIQAVNGDGVAGPKTVRSLTVVNYVPASFLADPEDITVVSGAGFFFAAPATGSPSPDISWQESTDNGINWGTLPGENSEVLEIDYSSNFWNGNLYRAVANNGSGDVFSAPAKLTVRDESAAPGWQIGLPTRTTVAEGASKTFTVSAHGLPSPTYQWSTSTDGVSWTPIPGATDSKYTVDKFTMEHNGGHLRATATNSIGTAHTDTQFEVIGGSPITSPSKATDVKIDGKGKYPVLTWGKPEDDGGSPITHYTANARSKSSGHLLSKDFAVDKPLSWAINGMNPGETYEIVVVAHNSVGNSVTTPIEFKAPKTTDGGNGNGNNGNNGSGTDNGNNNGGGSKGDGKGGNSDGKPDDKSKTDELEKTGADDVATYAVAGGLAALLAGAGALIGARIRRRA